MPPELLGSILEASFIWAQIHYSFHVLFNCDNVWNVKH